MQPPPLPRDTHRPEHIEHLDGIRACAALFVLVHHSLLTVYPIDYGQIPHGAVRWLVGIFLYGRFAVDVFIVLSGFCLMLPVIAGDMSLPGGPLGFYRRRAIRILPPYYASVAISLALAFIAIGYKTGSHWDISVPVTFYGVWTHMLLLNDVFANYNINHALWSIAVEWHIYFFFPLFIALWRKVGGLACTAIISAIGYTLFYVIGDGPLHGATPQYLALFAFGMLAAGISKAAMGTIPAGKNSRAPSPFGASSGPVGRGEVASDSTLINGMAERPSAKRPSRTKIGVADEDSCARVRALGDWRGWPVVAAVLALTVCVICCVWDFGVTVNHFGPLDGLVGASTAAMLISLMQPGPNRLRSLLSSKPLVFCGTFAYSIYLIHAPLVQLVWQYGVHPLYLSRPMEFLVQTVVGVPIIVALAYVFFLAFERPFLKRRRSA